MRQIYAQLRDKDDEISSLESQLATAFSKSSKQSEQNSSLHQKIAELEDHLKDSRIKHATLEQKISTMQRSEMDTAKALEIARRELRLGAASTDVLDKLKETNDTLQRQLIEYRDTVTHIQMERENAMASQQQELDKLRGELHDAQARNVAVAEENQRLAQTRLDLQMRLSELEARNASSPGLHRGIGEGVASRLLRSRMANAAGNSTTPSSIVAGSSSRGLPTPPVTPMSPPRPTSKPVSRTSDVRTAISASNKMDAAAQHLDTLWNTFRRYLPWLAGLFFLLFFIPPLLFGGPSRDPRDTQISELRNQVRQLATLVQTNQFEMERLMASREALLARLKETADVFGKLKGVVKDAERQWAKDVEVRIGSQRGGLSRRF